MTAISLAQRSPRIFAAILGCLLALSCRAADAGPPRITIARSPVLEEEPRATSDRPLHQHWLRCTPRDREPIPISLTIRGGASLGVWESGATWALIRLARASEDGTLEGWCPLDLRAITGTSAGSVNALLGALEWLRRTPSTYGDNALQRGWADIDLSTLIPEVVGRQGRRAPEDAVATRDAFQPTARLFLDGIADTDALRAGQVAIAMAVSRLEAPAASRDGLTTTSMRELVLASLEVPESGPARLTQPASPEAGRQLFLPQTHEGEIAPEALIQAVHASTAFPVLFGAVRLFGSFEPVTCATFSPQSCPQPLEDGWYVDGGVFDPAPLQVALSLTERTVPHTSAPDAHHLYLDPTRTRSSWPEPRREEELMRAADAQRLGALTPLLLLVNGMRSAGADYELSTLLRQVRFAQTPERRSEEGHQLHILTRGHPVMGTQTLLFAALFDRSFRDFDYLVGIYDALIFTGQLWCEGQPAPDDCLLDVLPQLHDALGLDDDADAVPLASTVTRALILRELDAPCDRLDPDWCPGGTSTASPLLALLEALRPREEHLEDLPSATGLVDSLVVDDGTVTLMHRYRDALARQGLSAELAGHTPFSRDFIADPVASFRRLASLMVDLAVRREAAGDLDRSEQRLSLLAARSLSMIVNQELRSHVNGLMLDPSSIPPWRRSGWRAAPWMMDVGLLDPTLRMGWRPSLYHGRYGLALPVALHAALAPLRGDVTVGVAPLLFRVRRVWLSELELAVNQSVLPGHLRDYHAGDGMSIEAAAYLFHSRIRIALACTPGAIDANPLGPSRCSVRIGLADIGGFFSHLAQPMSR